MNGQIQAHCFVKQNICKGDYQMGLGSNKVTSIISKTHTKLLWLVRAIVGLLLQQRYQLQVLGQFQDAKKCSRSTKICEMVTRYTCGEKINWKKCIIVTKKDVKECIIVPDNIRGQMWNIVFGLQNKLIDKGTPPPLDEIEEIDGGKRKRVEVQ